MLSAIRNFFITLLSALILLGLVGYLITDFALAAMDPEHAPILGPGETEEPSTDTAGDTLPPSILPTRDDSFTILLIGHDYQPDVFNDYDRSDEENPTGFPLPARPICADTIIVVRVDQRTKSTLLCSIPSNARVSDKGITRTLGELYGRYGAEALTERVSSIIGLHVDYYVAVSISGMTSMIDEIGGITYNVPMDMYDYDEEEDYTISLSAGTQTLSGRKVLQLLRFDKYGDDGTGQRNTALRVLGTIMSKIAGDRDYYQNAAAIYEAMQSYVETDFTKEIAATKLDLMFSYPEMSVSAITYPGMSIKEETRIEPETTTPPDPEPPVDSETTEAPPEDSGTDAGESTADPNVIVTWFYELDYISGRAIFSVYKS